MHTFKWIVEQNEFAKFMFNNDIFFEKLTLMRDVYKNMSFYKKKALTPTPDKLHIRMTELINREKVILSSDVKTFTDLWERL